MYQILGIIIGIVMAFLAVCYIVGLLIFKAMTPILIDMEHELYG